jgi:hypothetical protein
MQEVTFTYDTQKWAAKLRESLRTNAEAYRQCLLDWPRMEVVDRRSYRRRLWDRVFSNELLLLFGNQACMAEPYYLLMCGFPEYFVVQDGETPFIMIVYDDEVVLQKQFLALDRKRPRPDRPLRWFRTTVSVKNMTSTVTCEVRAAPA